MSLKVVKCPSDVLSLTNRAVVNPADFDPSTINHLEISTAPGVKYVMSIVGDVTVPPRSIAFGAMTRKWAVLSLGQAVEATPFIFDKTKQCVSQLTLEVDFYTKKGTTTDTYDTDSMAEEFRSKFGQLALTVGQQLVFSYRDMKLLQLIVKDIQGSDLREVGEGRKSQYSLTTGLLLPNSGIAFSKMEGSSIKLGGKSKGKVERQSIINPDWDFSKMGIGGLDEEFNAIFRRAFASRVFPPEVMEQLGCSHVKGILLHGPPGTGKTLMARQIGKMLNAKEPKIVNGPEILDKYVGESEANIRKLFAEAEADETKLGVNSPLHIIIFDEIDAICKKRGSVAGNTGVNDTVVNQLLSKIDGVDQLNNILVIGMTNRPDMIDEALTRPGRLEVQVEIGLPKENGRAQILNIHTRTMVSNGKLAGDVDLSELAKLTKNFSGAEIEGLVRAAQSCALNRLVKAGSSVQIDVDAAEKLLVSRQDFLHALKNDIKPALGSAEDVLASYATRGIIEWNSSVSGILRDGALLTKQVSSSRLVSLLLCGAPNSGKSALAATLATRSGAPFVKVVSPEDMVGYTEAAKCTTIRKIFDDAYRSDFSCIIVDNIERLIDYGAIGPRYSNLTLQALLVLLKKAPPQGRRLLVLATSSRREVLDLLEMLPCFTAVLPVPNMRSSQDVLPVVENSGVVAEADLELLRSKISGLNINIGVKSLIGVLDMVAQTDEGGRVEKLVSKLEEEALAL